MYNYIVSFFSNTSLPRHPFNKEYKKGYVKCWINNIKDYKP